MRHSLIGALSLVAILFALFAIVVWPSGCALVAARIPATAIPMEECDERCGTAAAEQLSLDIALLACDELVAAELSEEVTLERCQLAARVANSCRVLCR